ncbi:MULTISPECIES: hypothetical protein [Chryseobacterium]|uniref:Uncharacterized protein n=1 Tax=Chryseobacterium taihuense TaxID=1141221 RepID=A0A4V6IDX3_9FLAO|nr:MULTISPECIES: hypothetical protein [Chryseobacterium]QQV01646.1 hypothetical protein I6I61_11155 [Chryseobacterium sp. FDAARGOS 1104]VFB05154.1 Uncharacterised protein [Chryseobacterium taihuense]
MLANSYAFHNGKNKFNINKNSLEFRKFKQKYSKIFNKQDLEFAFRISQKIIKLKPGEEQYFSTIVNFPSYKSRFIDLKNKSEYYFQISLQLPNEIIKELYNPIKEKNNDVVFTRQIFSNKIPLIYEVYNNNN